MEEVSKAGLHDDAGGHDWPALKERIREWARALGFQQTGVAGVDLSAAEARLLEWLGRGFHGDMDYLSRHGTRRTRPAELVPGTVSVITARLNYFPRGSATASQCWDGRLAFVSRYALGRDYHKVLRDRLQQLADRIRDESGPFGYRVFTDSAPVMEVELAAQAGLGWRGKHTLLLNREAGSWFFLGEIYCDLPLPPDEPETEHCGTCQRCIEVCPTRAIVAPYQLDARRCISYLTIEHHGSIPEALRPLMGNRIYGCDDCQLVCPWNRFAQRRSSRTSKCATDWTARRSSSYSPGARSSSWRACRAARSGGSATSAGCATSPSRWATRRPRRGRAGAARPRRPSVGSGARACRVGAGAACLAAAVSDEC